MNSDDVGSVDLRGPRLRVRRARLEDASASYSWFANPAVTEYLPLAGKAALPIDHIETYLARVEKTDRPEIALTIEMIGEGPIGCGGFRNFDTDAAELRLVLGEPSLWGRGLGTEAMQLMLAFAFRTLGLKRIWLVVRADNERAVRLFTRIGMVVVEKLIGVTVADGTPRDKLRMELAAPRS